LLGFGDNKY